MLYRTKQDIRTFLIASIAIGLFAPLGITTLKLATLSRTTTIPTFTEEAIDYAHTYTNTATWPMVGGTIFDLEGDGTPEAFISGAAGQPDLILAYRGDAFVDITDELGISSLASVTHDAHATDIDADGDDDLLVIRDDGLFLYTNTHGRLRERVIPITLDDHATPLTITSGDIDGDDLPELYISTFIHKTLFKPATFNDPDHLTHNIFLSNEGNGSFRDITDESGLTFNQNTFLARIIDLNDDGLRDVIVVPNTDRARIYQNNGDRTFTEAAPLTDYGFWMGIATGDIDNDGDVDIFLSNAGGSLPRFLLTGDATDDQPIDTDWRLLRNDGDLSFTDITVASGVGYHEFAWGSLFSDFNNDGHLDLYVAENYIKWPLHRWLGNPGRLLINDGTGVFTATEGRSGVTTRDYGQTPLVADFDTNGYDDLIVINQNGPVTIFMNDGE